MWVHIAAPGSINLVSPHVHLSSGGGGGWVGGRVGARSGADDDGIAIVAAEALAVTAPRGMAVQIDPIKPTL